MTSIVVHYHEISLKGANRRWFEDRLVANIRARLARLFPENSEHFTVLRQHGRIIVEINNKVASVEEADATRAIGALKQVFGIAHFSVLQKTPTDLASLQKTAVALFDAHLEKNKMPRTFRVRLKRSDKRIEGQSPSWEKELGLAIHAKHPSLTLELKNPEFTLRGELHQGTSYLYTDKIEGPRGLPCGTNGHLLTLLSGGIDSPVAAIQMLKRGATSAFIHFSGAPFVGPEALEKVEALVRHVNCYQHIIQPLHVIPFGKIQEKIALTTDAKLRTILYRRLMIKIATAIAPKLGVQALITGEALGQVASQTIQNMVVINSVTSPQLPVLRPLLSFDKSEIIDLAIKYQCYETSILPATDCCTLFADRHPQLKATEVQIAEQERRIDTEALIEEACNGRQMQWCE